LDDAAFHFDLDWRQKMSEQDARGRRALMLFGRYVLFIVLVFNFVGIWNLGCVADCGQQVESSTLP
jgi:hypothetical protein